MIENGLADPSDVVSLTPLSGGVSADIWRVRVGPSEFCVKRALPRLRTARIWEVSPSRNASEWAWLELVAEILPHAVPTVLAHDVSNAMFAMEYLPESTYGNWKGLLRDGSVSLETAQRVGEGMGVIHAATANDPAIAARFANDDLFFALRLEPYLVATARAHPALSDQLNALVKITADTKNVLVHGDFSPKNILVGPHGPVFLDAECAWFGDPAFDLAFVLNHFLLKTVWHPEFIDRYVDAFRVLSTAYLSRVDWENTGALEQRCARLLPALTLARIDGTSPVEYLDRETDQRLVRETAIALLRSKENSLSDVLSGWIAAVQEAP